MHQNPSSRPQAKQRCVSISGSGVIPRRESRGQSPLVPAAKARESRGQSPLVPAAKARESRGQSPLVLAAEAKCEYSLKFRSDVIAIKSIQW